ncbi:putative leucine-rich repeat domain superfamily [Helianthus debilis subsp. tardiflorus]
MQTSNEFHPMGKLFSQVEEIVLVTMDSLEVLCDSPHQYISFRNLQTLHIDQCPSLLKLFPSSVARGLANLREIRIYICYSLVAVIFDEDEQTCGDEIEEAGGSEIKETGGSKTEPDTDIVFDQLTSIAFIGLSNLESFYSGHSTIRYPSLKIIELFQCSSMKRWSYGENHMPNLESQHKPYSNINDYIAAERDGSGSLTIIKSLWDDTEGSSWL